MARRRHDSETKNRSPRSKAGKYIRALMCITGRHETVEEIEQVGHHSSDQSPVLQHSTDVKAQNLSSKKDSRQAIDNDECGNQDQDPLAMPTQTSLEISKTIETNSECISLVKETKDSLPGTIGHVMNPAVSAEGKPDTNQYPELEHSSTSSNSSRSNCEPQGNSDTSFLGKENNLTQNGPLNVETSLAASSTGSSGFP